MKRSLLTIRSIAAALCLLGGVTNSRAQGTAFTYQGRLNNGSAPATGIYDLRFTIYDSSGGPTVVAGPLTNSGVAVSNGLFTVMLDFGGGVFTGAGRWLDIGVRTNGGAFAALSPRQVLTATPYAVFAGTVGSGGLAAGTYGNAVVFNNAANSFSGNGTGLSNVNAISLGGFGASSFWNLGGNAGTTPGAQFLGTTDNLPMEFKVNGARALRLEPNPNAPNVIGGSAANEVTNGNYGAVIAGGGSSFYPNRVGAIFGTVVGGNGNTASGNFATAMGQFNTASGYAGTAMGYSTVAGGFGSQAGGTTAKANHDGSFVWADNNFADFTSTAANQFLIRAAGGVGININNPNGAALAVNGNVTVNNTIGTPGNQPLELKVNNQRGLRLEPTTNTDTVNVIGGSARNFVSPGVAGATIGGGGAGDFTYLGLFSFTNQVESSFGTVSGGGNNTILTGAEFTTIGGGLLNTIQAARTATIGGGQQNTIETAVAATIGGGSRNDIQSGGEFATIGGGLGNTIQGSANYSTIGGGAGNTIQTNAFFASIGGGLDNKTQPNADFATIPGGESNSATNYAFAAGRRAKANHTGAFVWADSTDADFASTANNQFLIRASGGVGIGTGSPGAQLDVASSGNTTIRISGPSAGGPGVAVACEFATYSPGLNPPSARILATDDGNWSDNLDLMTKVPGAAGNALQSRLHIASSGSVGIGTVTPVSALQVIGTVTATAFNPPSDRNLKENFAPVSPREVLEQVAALPISRWNFKGDTATPHLGPMAQDFHAAFRLGTDERHIATVDADGVALAAIQGLNQKLTEELNRRDAENAELKARLSLLEKIVANLGSKGN